MIVVSGCPRSGTSLMMNCLRHALGDDRILGHEFPSIENKLEKFNEKKPHETEEQYQLRMYLSKKMNPDLEEDLEETKDLNPNGFWECTFSVRGVYFTPQFESFLEEMEFEDENKLTVCKIVSQGLAQSDPRYIHKVIYMLRDPYSVAKSQERLKRNMTFIHPETGGEVNLFDEVTIHSPEMFIKVSLSAAQWLENHPEIPVLFVNYDDLIQKPNETLNIIQDFLQEGNFEKAKSIINPKLKRSYAEPEKSDLWEDAEYVYEKMLNQDFNFMEFLTDKKRKFNRLQRKWPCLRARQYMIEPHCKACKSDKKFRESLKEYAKSANVDWQNEPCVFECGFNLDSDPITIEKSIENNFWND